MLAEIENRLFVGAPDKKGKSPLYCLNSLDSNYFRCVVKFIVFSFSILIVILLNLVLYNCSYFWAVYFLCFVLIRSAGEIMAASLAQGGPRPNFMREWCFSYLCSGDSDSIQVSASDVTDGELSLLIEKVNTVLSKLVFALTSLWYGLCNQIFGLLPLDNDTVQINLTWHLLCFQINSATNDNINDLLDDIVTCGYTGVVTMEKRDSMIRYAGDICFSLRCGCIAQEFVNTCLVIFNGFMDYK